MWRRKMVIALAGALMACGGGDSGTITPGADTAGSPSTGTTTPDPGVAATPDPGPTVTADPGTGVRYDLGSLDEGPLPPTRTNLACGSMLDEATGTKVIGETCTDHSECSTGYCYDEWYLGWPGGTRFCTVACNGCSFGKQMACVEFVQPGGPNLKCLIGTGCHATAFGAMEVRGFCVPACTSVDTCDGAYGVGTYTTCQIPFIKSNDCGGLGARKMCFVPEP